MQVSAEVRWFWSNPVPELEKWFRDAGSHGFPAGGGSPRTDEYVRDPEQVELGVKRRGKKKGVEVKGLVRVDWSGQAVAPFSGPIEFWTKWTAAALDLGASAMVITEKTRWLRKFDTTGPIPHELQLDADEKPMQGTSLPALGCNVEFTHVKVPQGVEAWTLGFESFGTLETAGNDLRAVASLLADRVPPVLPVGLRMSYPSWLARLGK